MSVSAKDVLNGTNALRALKSFVDCDAQSEIRTRAEKTNASSAIVCQSHRLRVEIQNEPIKSTLMVSFSFLASFMYFPIN